ncbi:MAG: hypothetical protein V1729_01175 [Candidatus Woesearchaeota archaeon]
MTVSDYNDRFEEQLLDFMSEKNLQGQLLIKREKIYYAEMSNVNFEVIADVRVLLDKRSIRVGQNVWTLEDGAKIDILQKSYIQGIHGFQEQTAPLLVNISSAYNDLLELTVVDLPFPQPKRYDQAVFFMDYPEFNAAVYARTDLVMGLCDEVHVVRNAERGLGGELLSNLKEMHDEEEVNVYTLKNPSRRVMGGHMLIHVMDQLSQYRTVVTERGDGTPFAWVSENRNPPDKLVEMMLTNFRLPHGGYDN